MANSCTHKALYKKWTFEPQRINNWAVLGVMRIAYLCL